MDNSTQSVLRGNSIENNSTAGIKVGNGSFYNKFVQNTLASNAGKDFLIESAEVTDYFSKNNLYSGVSNTVEQELDFTRNYWGTSSRSEILGMQSGDEADSIIWLPFRTSQIDTAVGADTIAPSAPDIVVADTDTLGEITVEWTVPATNEDGFSPANIDGYRLYRFTESDTDDWENYFIYQVEDAAETSYIDNQISANTSYFYRVVAYTEHTGPYADKFYNRSWYSASYETEQTIDAEIEFFQETVHDTRVTNISIAGISSGPEELEFSWRYNEGPWQIDQLGEFELTGISLEPGSNLIEARLRDNSDTVYHELMIVRYYPVKFSWRRPFQWELVPGEVKINIGLNALAGDTVELSWALNDMEDTLIAIDDSLAYGDSADSIQLTMDFPDPEPGRYQLTLQHFSLDGEELVNYTRTVVQDPRAELFEPSAGEAEVEFSGRNLKGTFSAGTLVSISDMSIDLSDTVQLANAASGEIYDSVHNIADDSLTRFRLSADTEGTFELELPFNIMEATVMGVDAEDLEIYRLNEAEAVWERTGVVTRDRRQVDGDTWVVEAEVTGFSLFQIMASTRAEGLDDFIVGPNPYRARSDDFIRFYFDSEDGPFDIDIYTITGQQVYSVRYTGQDYYDWTDAQDVASGYYIYRVKDRGTGEEKTGKLAIIR